MSKIMRQVYAEARAAREAKANPVDRRTQHAQSVASSRLEGWSLPVPNPTASGTTTIQWWIDQVAQAGKRLRSRSAAVE